jgi:hypothetical protein
MHLRNPRSPIHLRLLIDARKRYPQPKSFSPFKTPNIKSKTYELALLGDTLLTLEALDVELDDPDAEEMLVTVPLTLDWDDTLEETEILDDWLEVEEIEVTVPERVDEVDTDTDPETDEEPLTTVPEDVEVPEMDEVIHVVTNLETVLVT